MEDRYITARRMGSKSFEDTWKCVEDFGGYIIEGVEEYMLNVNYDNEYYVGEYYTTSTLFGYDYY